jgi:hypothetical protein
MSIISNTPAFLVSNDADTISLDSYSIFYHKLSTTLTPRANGLRYWRWGGTWTLFGSRKNSKPKKCLKMQQNPQRPVHALLGAVELEVTLVKKDASANMKRFNMQLNF